MLQGHLFGVTIRRVSSIAGGIKEVLLGIFSAHDNGWMRDSSFCRYGESHPTFLCCADDVKAMTAHGLVGRYRGENGKSTALGGITFSSAGSTL